VRSLCCAGSFSGGWACSSVCTACRCHRDRGRCVWVVCSSWTSPSMLGIHPGPVPEAAGAWPGGSWHLLYAHYSTICAGDQAGFQGSLTILHMAGVGPPSLPPDCHIGRPGPGLAIQSEWVDHGGRGHEPQCMGWCGIGSAVCPAGDRLKKPELCLSWPEGGGAARAVLRGT
jgi:hypothetical protein